MTDPLSKEQRLTEIRTRVSESLAKIRKATKFVPKEGKLTVALEFEDEIDLAEQWMVTLADCKFLLEQDGGEPL